MGSDRNCVTGADMRQEALDCFSVVEILHLGEFTIGSYLKVKDGSRISCTCQRKIFFISSESLFEWLYF